MDVTSKLNKHKGAHTFHNIVLQPKIHVVSKKIRRADGSDVQTQTFINLTTGESRD